MLKPTDELFERLSPERLASESVTIEARLRLHVVMIYPDKVVVEAVATNPEGVPIARMGEHTLQEGDTLDMRGLHFDVEVSADV